MWFQKPPLGTPLDWGNPLNDETVLALAMNEGHGDKLQDLSMNDNHGTLTNFAFPPTAASGWNPGQTGIGLNFDSAGNDYIDCGRAANLLCANVTWSFFTFVSSSGAGTHRYYSLNHWASPSGELLYIRDSTNKFNYHLGNGVVAIGITSDLAIPTDVWTHIAVTYDSITAKMYINGDIQADQKALSGGIAYAAKDIWLGHSANSIEGGVDQLRRLSRPWSAKEVRDYAINPWQVYLDEGGM